MENQVEAFSLQFKIYCVCSIGGDTLAMGGETSDIAIVNVQTHEVTGKLKGHRYFVNCLKLAPGNRLLSGSWDRTIILWDPESKCILRTFLGHTDSVNSLAILQNEDYFISASNDKSMRLWRTSASGCEQLYRGHEYSILCNIELVDGRILSGSADYTIKAWNAASGECEATWEGHKEAVTWIVQLNDAKVVSVSGDKCMRVWEADTAECLRIIHCHERWINCVLELSSNYIITGSYDKSLRVWDIFNTDESELVILEGHDSCITGIVQLEDGKIVSSSADCTVRIWTVPEIVPAPDYLLK